MVITANYDYDLPPDLIAQTPAEPRDSARLLALRRGSQETQGARGIAGEGDDGDAQISHHVFRELPALLRPGDVLVANNSRVLPARLRGRRAATGGAVEVLLLHRSRAYPTMPPVSETTQQAETAGQGNVAAEEWAAMVRPGRRIRPGDELVFGDGLLVATVLERLEGGERLVRLHTGAPDVTVREAIGRVGATPLPPYIHAPLADPERYQTVYARPEGSVAAPTAGLHFTPQTLRALEERGVTMRHVTLHVGAGTFKPMAGDDPAAHTMHQEWAELDAATAAYLNSARAEGRRIVAVGTTSVRVLETAAMASVADGESQEETEAREDTKSWEDNGPLRPFSGWTAVFIRPGHVFRATDALITNFHLPRSTLLLLVSALAGKEAIDRAYREAIAHRYRFYSFGDAMLIE